jgi:hypothetical protein
MNTLCYLSFFVELPFLFLFSERMGQHEPMPGSFSIPCFLFPPTLPTPLFPEATVRPLSVSKEMKEKLCLA